MTDQVTQAIIRLFDRERFYAELILSMDRILTNRIPTACVCIKDTIQLHINPKFFDGLTKEEQVAVLKHECQHILNDHIPRFKELCPAVYEKSNDLAEDIIHSAKHKLMNIAADCAINPGIQDIPKWGQFPGIYKLPDGQTMEWYAENLKNNAELKGLTEYDSHSLWDESEGGLEEVKAKLRKAIKESADKTRAAGQMTSDLEMLVDRLTKESRDWRKDLRRFAAKNVDKFTESSRKKRNRRYGIIIPGSVKIEELHIGVAVDTSGSISDEQLNQFMAEIGNIAKYAMVTVVEADSEVKNSYLYNPKKQYKVAGRGGTAYQPAFDYFTKETEVDGVIYFGDMDCFDTGEIKKPTYPVLWAIVGDQEPPVSWGAKTNIDIKSKL